MAAPGSNVGSSGSRTTPTQGHPGARATRGGHGGTHFPELGAVPGRIARVPDGREVVFGGGEAYIILKDLEANHFGRTVLAARAVPGRDGRVDASNDPRDSRCLKFTCVVRLPPSP